MAEHETITDVIAWLRRPREGENAYLTLWRDEIADRLEATIKRERAKIEADALAVGGIVEAERKRERGDCAKLREACANIAEYARSAMCHATDAHLLGYLNQIEGWSKAALAAQPRNCDVPLVVDGPADNNADKAWLVFKQHNHDAYFDVPGLLRCIDWLLAPATEKEGGNDGR